jgi:hypothetical protein
LAETNKIYDEEERILNKTENSFVDFSLNKPSSLLKNNYSEF